MQETNDPYLWLEAIEDQRALNWVKNQRQALDALENAKGFQGLRNQIETALNARDNIPMPECFKGRYYNFWKDEKHPRGLWRRTTPESYATSDPLWEVVFDLDEVARLEQVNWVWKGATLCPERPERALLYLSRGGADAVVIREYDLIQKAFVSDGFELPECKQSVCWKDADTIWFTAALNDQEKTLSGYPYITREWTRGESLQDARVVHSGSPEDVGAWCYSEPVAGKERPLIRQLVQFFNATVQLEWQGQVRALQQPPRAEATFFQDQVVYWLREELVQKEQTFPAGSLLSTALENALDSSPEYSLLFQPTEGMSVQSITVTRDHVLVTALNHVRSEVYAFSRSEQGWIRSQIPVPELMSIQLWAEDASNSDAAFMMVTGFLTPNTLYRLLPDGTQQPLKANPMHFDPAGLQVEQHFATSKDGTRIPYFQVASSSLKLDGQNPTLLYGYGGFENARMPTYSAALGQGWLTRGGVYVLANIRGGGEYGPAWHQSALKANRQNAYDDFIAVAEDLIQRKVTTPEHLGTRGGSNGGLLTSVMLTQRPDLFGAVVSEVPLTDMFRYHKMLAGASWMAEYGDPESSDWNFLSQYSPYHNIKPATEQKYPKTIYLSSTRDDRVHPGHARKMVAKLQESGHDVLYYENIEGGHGGSANHQQMAHWQALVYSFLWQELSKV